MTHVKPLKDSDLPKKAQVEQMFDNIAHRYDFLNHFLSLGIDNIWRKITINSLKSSKPQHILDVATGTGDLAFEALKRLKPEKIVGLDLSEGMLSKARIKAKERKIDGIEFVKGDSEKINYPDETFDAVTVAFGVRNFEHLQEGLAEIYRVMQPGAKVAILEFSKPTGFPIKQLYNFYFKYILPVFGRFFSKDATAYQYLPDSVQAFPEGKEFIKILESLGFKSCKNRPLTFGICSLYTGQK